MLLLSSGGAPPPARVEDEVRGGWAAARKVSASPPHLARCHLTGAASISGRTGAFANHRAAALCLTFDLHGQIKQADFCSLSDQILNIFLRFTMEQ